jgi:uncharacterized protein with HEPN domain
MVQDAVIRNLQTLAESIWLVVDQDLPALAAALTRMVARTRRED